MNNSWRPSYNVGNIEIYIGIEVENAIRYFLLAIFGVGKCAEVTACYGIRWGILEMKVGTWKFELS